VTGQAGQFQVRTGLAREWQARPMNGLYLQASRWWKPWATGPTMILKAYSLTVGACR
jgi:hypothetical protein